VANQREPADVSFPAVEELEVREPAEAESAAEVEGRGDGDEVAGLGLGVASRVHVSRQVVEHVGAPGRHEGHREAHHDESRLAQQPELDVAGNEALGEGLLGGRLLGRRHSARGLRLGLSLAVAVAQAWAHRQGRGPQGPARDRDLSSYDLARLYVPEWTTKSADLAFGIKNANNRASVRHHLYLFTFRPID
jgi:hypothetical protein